MVREGRMADKKDDDSVTEPWPTFKGEVADTWWTTYAGDKLREMQESMKLGPEMFKQEYLAEFVEARRECVRCHTNYTPPEGWDRKRCPYCHDEAVRGERVRVRGPEVDWVATDELRKKKGEEA